MLPIASADDLHHETPCVSGDSRRDCVAASFMKELSRRNDALTINVGRSGVGSAQRESGA